MPGGRLRRIGKQQTVRGDYGGGPVPCQREKKKKKKNHLGPVIYTQPTGQGKGKRETAGYISPSPSSERKEKKENNRKRGKHEPK